MSAVQPSVSIEQARQRLLDHPLYDAITDVADLRVFMRHHVFAVWDFFSLLKRLQREVTCVETPWFPTGHADHGRFIMEIVISEEADEDLAGGYVSHYELYRRAMTEIGADERPISDFTARASSATNPLDALQADELPGSVTTFLEHTLTMALHGEPHEVAASFCHGRENLLPDVLGALRRNVGDAIADAPVFTHYIDRHIELDHDEHGPLALKLLSSLCDGDADREAEADRAGVAAVEARIALWDGIVQELGDRRAG